MRMMSVCVGLVGAGERQCIMIFSSLALRSIYSKTTGRHCARLTQLHSVPHTISYFDTTGALCRLGLWLTGCDIHYFWLLFYVYGHLLRRTENESSLRHR